MPLDRDRRKEYAVNEAWCFKCKVKREMATPEEYTMKNGRRGTKGQCPVCGSNMARGGRVQ